jgi:hypothetical protein
MNSVSVPQGIKKSQQSPAGKKIDAKRPNWLKNNTTGLFFYVQK